MRNKSTSYKRISFFHLIMKFDPTFVQLIFFPNNFAKSDKELFSTYFLPIWIILFRHTRNQKAFWNIMVFLSKKKCLTISDFVFCSTALESHFKTLHTFKKMLDIIDCSVQSIFFVHHLYLMKKNKDLDG